MKREKLASDPGAFGNPLTGTIDIAPGVDPLAYRPRYFSKDYS